MNYLIVSMNPNVWARADLKSSNSESNTITLLRCFSPPAFIEDSQIRMYGLLSFVLRTSKKKLRRPDEIFVENNGGVISGMLN
jgi:hypothetical protein